MDGPQLVTAVEEALRRSVIVDDPAADRFPWVPRRVFKKLRVSSAEKERLIAVIQAQDELAIFDNRLQVLCGLAHQVTHQDLADWLVARAHEAGATAVVEELKRYLREKEIPFLEVAALSGVSVAEPSDLARGIRVIPLSEVPDSLAKDLVFSEPIPLLLGTHRPSPSAALTCRSLLPKSHPRPGIQDLSLGEGRRQELLDACLLLTLQGPSAPFCVGSYAIPEPWIPCQQIAGVGISRPFAVETPFLHTVPLTSEMLEHAKHLHERFTSLSEPSKAKLRISVERLNWAMRRPWLADKAIDLGVAFEALFLSDREPDRGELGFTLRIRGARFLGSSLGERIEIAELIRRIYRIRSEAVHTGIAPPQVNGIDSKDLLQEGVRLLARALDKVLRCGVPDWLQLVLE